MIGIMTENEYSGEESGGGNQDIINTNHRQSDGNGDGNSNTN